MPRLDRHPLGLEGGIDRCLFGARVAKREQRVRVRARRTVGRGGLLDLDEVLAEERDVARRDRGAVGTGQVRDADRDVLESLGTPAPTPPGSVWVPPRAGASPTAVPLPAMPVGATRASDGIVQTTGPFAAAAGSDATARAAAANTVATTFPTTARGPVTSTIRLLAAPARAAICWRGGTGTAPPPERTEHAGTGLNNTFPRAGRARRKLTIGTGDTPLAAAADGTPAALACPAPAPAQRDRHLGRARLSPGRDERAFPRPQEHDHQRARRDPARARGQPRGLRQNTGDPADHPPVAR